MPTLKPIGQIVLTCPGDPRRELSFLSARADLHARSVTLNAQTRLPYPHSSRLNDIAEWMLENDLDIISAAQTDARHTQRVIIGARP